MDQLAPMFEEWQPLLRIALIVLSAVLLRVTIRLASRRIVNSVAKSTSKAQAQSPAEAIVAEARALQRTRTIASVIDRSASWAIWLTAAIMTLSELGIDIGALIAVTTVLGAAIGFGAQSAVKDLIAGVFIIFEDQYGVGDWVDLDGISGEVERIGLRTSQLRDSQGTLWFIRNGEILRVGNSSQEWAKAVIEVGFTVSTQLELAENLLRSTAQALRDDPEIGPLILSDLEFKGVEHVSADSYLVRGALKTLPKKQWQVGNALRARLVVAARKSNIQLTEASRPARGVQ